MAEVWRKPSASAETASFTGYLSLVASFLANLIKQKVERLAQRGQWLGTNSWVKEQALWTGDTAKRRRLFGRLNSPNRSFLNLAQGRFKQRKLSLKPYFP
jgi:hypothetical protein